MPHSSFRTTCASSVLSMDCGDLMFQTIVREETLATRVTGQVESLIIESRLQPGVQLPAERQLASQFGVSRTVIREAVRSLVAKGLLDVKPGSGTVVSTPSARSV